MDAKYSGWNEKKKCYKLPGNMDIYKQFFYQEQMLRIYEQAGQKDVCVYNFLIFPDQMKDTGQQKAVNRKDWLLFCCMERLRTPCEKS